MWTGRLVLSPETEDRAPGSGPLRTTVLEVSLSVAADGGWRGLEVRKKEVNPVLKSAHWGVGWCLEDQSRNIRLHLLGVGPK